MQVLFAISVASFLILAFAAVAMVRHVRAGRRNAGSYSQPKSGSSYDSSQGFSQHLLHAVENRELRLPQEVRFQSVKEIAANKTWNTPSKLVEIPPTHGQVSSLGLRKGPQSARPAAQQRVDRAYYNEDSGDLTDPYQSRPSRKQISTRRS